MRKPIVVAAVVALMACVFIACTGKKVYDNYESTPLTGWERNDTLTFEVSPMLATGTYESTLGLRINAAYPFTRLRLIVEQTVLPQRRTVTDTVQCRLVDDNGHYLGKGVSLFQYEFSVSQLYLHRGDSLRVSVRHDMKRDILPGISDVGYQLTGH